MNNSFLAEVEREDKPAFPGEDQEEKETPPESPAEKEPKENKLESQAGDKEKDETPESKKGELEVFHAFHEHPRWKALQNELQELKEFQERVLPLLEDLGKAEVKSEKSVEIPEWFTDVFGENEAAWKKYQAYDVQQRSQLREEILKEVEEKAVASSQEEKKYEKWVDDQVALLEADGLKFNRNELMKVAIDFAPTDEDGNISLRKAYDILQAQKGKKEEPKSDEKKKVADQTMGKQKADGEKKDYKTSQDLRGKSFSDFLE